MLQLDDVASRRAGTFSGGMRRRLDLGQALVHQPRVVFLDEPTTGLDPQNRRALWSYLRELNDRGTTVFLTTQYLEEADELAQRLAIIDHGKIAIEGTPRDLKDGLGGDAISVTLAADATADDLVKAAAALEPISDAGASRTYEGSVRIFTRDGGTRLADVVRALDAAGVSVARLELAEPTLDDVFLRHTGERMRVEEVKATGHSVISRRRRR